MTDGPTGAPAEHLVLVGMMGSGKTTVGRLLADRLGRRYLDNDELVRQLSGREPADIDASDGEDALHAFETDALLDALRSPGPTVIGAAAWVVQDEAASAALRDDADVVWLRAGPETLLRRIGSGAGRRDEATDPDWLAQQAQAREDHYGRVADLVIDVDDRTPEQIAEEIVRWSTGRRPSPIDTDP